MTGRDSRQLQDDPAGDAEAKAAATSTAIAGLRRRLKRDGIGDPSVRKELGKLEELLTSLFEQAGHPGRHRSQVSKAPGRQPGQEPSDMDTPDLKPDPAEAITRRTSSPCSGGTECGQGTRPGAGWLHVPSTRHRTRHL